MSPKDGKAGTIVAPIDPKAAEEAGVADPGEFEKMVFQQVKTQTGRFGKAKIAAHKPPPEDPAEKSEEKKVTWIEIELKDDANQPMASSGLKRHSERMIAAAAQLCRPAARVSHSARSVISGAGTPGRACSSRNMRSRAILPVERRSPAV